MALFADYEPERHGGPALDGLRTRVAAEGDVEALAALRVARGDATPDEARLSFQHLLGRARRDGALVLVAEHRGCVVGYGAANPLGPPLPDGWYLGGVIVSESMRRRGVGTRLTRERLDWIATRAAEAFYFVNERNRSSIDLHARFGFREISRDIRVPGVTFTGGVGLLFRADLSKPEAKP